MSEWKEVKLGEVASFSYGTMPKKEKLGLGVYPTFSGYKYQHKYPDFNCEKGDVIVVARGVGGTGDVKIVKERCYLTNLSIKINLEEERVDKKYFYYSFYMETLRYLDSGSAQSQITIKDLERIILLLPPLPEQKAIASVLSSLDDKIDLLHRQNKTLEAMAETLFRQWFLPAEASAQVGVDGKLGDVIDLVYGKGLKEEIRTGAGFPVVGSSGIVGYHSEYFVEGPGIVIGRKGTLGKVIYLWDNFFPIDTTYFVKSKLDSKGLYYEYFLLKTLNFEDMNSDSAVPGLNRDIALLSEIKIPRTESIKEFDIQCSNIFKKILGNNKQIHTLEKLRDTLLPKLMSGEVRVLNHD